MARLPKKLRDKRDKIMVSRVSIFFSGTQDVSSGRPVSRSSRTEKDRARASADVKSSQKTVAQRLPHEEKIPQGNALRSIFLRVKSFVLFVLIVGLLSLGLGL